MLLDLLFEYKKTLRETKKQKEQLEDIPEKERSIEDNEDVKQYNSMISDLKFAIEWLENGRLPGAKRGYDKKAVYRTILFDPKVFKNAEFESVSLPNDSEESSKVDRWDRQRIEDALSVLTKRERDIFLLHYTQMLSYDEIAALLEVKKATVQTHIKRCKRKLEQRKSESLFCMM